ncbi:MAG: hypothetical protein QM773_02870 [Hyphomonadaceae bacterium]
MFARLKGVYQSAMEIDGDDYVPFSADTNLGWTGELVALRYGDYEKSLVEIMFDERTGIVTKFAMPFWKRVNVLASAAVKTVPGVPVIEPPSHTFEGPSGCMRLDCPADFALTLHNRELTLAIDGSADPVGGIGEGRVIFLVDAAQLLVGLRIADLTPNELRALGIT